MIHRLPFPRLSRLLPCALLLAAGLSSCSTAPRPVEMPEQAAAPQAQDDSFWIGDGVSGSPRLVIDLSAQRVRYYKGDKLVGRAPISSGREGHSTVTGTYRISQKSQNHRSSLYGDYVDADGNVVVSDVDVRKDPKPPGTRFLGAKMNYFMRVVGAIGMHEGYLPGYPASHGCIRMPGDMAAKFFHATPHGTPVTIVGDASQAPYEPPVRYAAPPAQTPNPEWQRPGRRSRPPKRTPAAAGTTYYL